MIICTPQLLVTDDQLPSVDTDRPPAPDGPGEQERRCWLPNFSPDELLRLFKITFRLQEPPAGSIATCHVYSTCTGRRSRNRIIFWPGMTHTTRPRETTWRQGICSLLISTPHTTTNATSHIYGRTARHSLWNWLDDSPLPLLHDKRLKFCINHNYVIHLFKAASTLSLSHKLRACGVRDGIRCRTGRLQNRNRVSLIVKQFMAQCCHF